MGKLVLRKTILRNMIDRVWAALGISYVNIVSLYLRFEGFASVQ
jgi:hypothetical protein